MFNLDAAITNWRRQMATGGIKSPAVLDELESHLRGEVEQQMRSGLDTQESLSRPNESAGRCSKRSSGKSAR
jgi:hypothetical protein